mgnify:CR=1 FL=1
MATQLVNRLVVFVRGILLGQVLGKTLRLDGMKARDKAPTTLMEADIDGITTGVPDVLGAPVNFLELAVAAFDLTRLIGRTSFLVVIPIIGQIPVPCCFIQH